MNGTWTATGSLAGARANHTATLLPDGKVLVVGGDGGSSGDLASAELYDPASGFWTATDSLAKPRFFGFSATSLPSGKVLLIGGFSLFHARGSAQIYNPGSGTWKTTTSPDGARSSHTATLLLNGNVLVAAGFRNGLSSQARNSTIPRSAHGRRPATSPPGANFRRRRCYLMVRCSSQADKARAVFLRARNSTIRRVGAGVTSLGRQRRCNKERQRRRVAGCCRCALSLRRLRPLRRHLLSGTFINLAHGSTVTIGSNIFQASHQGGTGNDLTLTVQ